MAIISIKVKPCKLLLLMLLVCIHSVIKSVLRYKFLILDTYHPGTLYLCEQGYEDLWLIFQIRKGSTSKKSLGNTAIGQLITEYITGMATVPKTGLKHMLLSIQEKGRYNKHGRCYLKFSLQKKTI